MTGERVGAVEDEGGIEEGDGGGGREFLFRMSVAINI